MEVVATVAEIFSWCHNFFQKTRQKFMYFLSNLRTLCVIQDRICVEMLEKIAKCGKQLLLIGLIPFQTICALLSQNSKCREIRVFFGIIFLPQKLRSWIFFNKSYVWHPWCTMFIAPGQISDVPLFHQSSTLGFPLLGIR